MSSFVLLLILACPLMMFFMMRGMHGGHGHAQGGGHDRDGADSSASLDELRRRREQLDRQIEEREAGEKQSPVGAGGR